MDNSDDSEHSHNHDSEHGHQHGHELDQGWRGALRYLRYAPKMWQSELNTTVVALLNPKAEETVVDIGAGMGAGSVVAARSAATVKAVEPTPFMRRVLSLRRFWQTNRKTLEIIDAGVENMPISDRSVDAVFSVNTMHHWVDPAKGVSEIARILTQGGRFLLVDEDFTDPTHPEFEQWTQRHDHHHCGDEGHTHGFSMVDAKEMASLFGSVGLVDTSAESRQIANRPCIVVTGTTS